MQRADIGPGHPVQGEIERFMRGERADGKSVVRHLLAGCPVCLEATRRCWSLGERETAAAAHPVRSLPYRTAVSPGSLPT